MKRADDFKERRAHLADLSEAELEDRFWSLAEELIEPIIDLGYKNTSPSIERSVLLRMGFSSIEAKSIVDNSIDRGLIGKGVGHIVYKLAVKKGIPIREAGLLLVDGKAWDEVKPMFQGGAK